MRRYVLVLVAAALGLSGCSTHTVRVEVENDAFAKSGDANYTNGLQVMISPLEPSDRLLRLADKINFLKETSGPAAGSVKGLGGLGAALFENRDREPAVGVSYGFGQVFYTPNDISVTDLDSVDEDGRLLRLDRPYAGFLYAGFEVDNFRAATDELDWSRDRRRTVALKIGVTGAASQSDSVQRWYHREGCDCTPPAGWHMQVGQELGVVVSAEQENRVWNTNPKRRWRSDLLARGKASLGNIYTGLDAGLTFRAGYGVPRSMHPNTIADAVLGFGDGPGPGARPKFHAFVFAGLGARYVARDFSLDGALSADNIHTVKRKPFVHEEQVGFEIGYKRFALRALWAWRSRQFTTQEQSNHRFGSIMLIFRPKLSI